MPLFAKGNYEGLVDHIMNSFITKRERNGSYFVIIFVGMYMYVSLFGVLNLEVRAVKQKCRYQHRLFYTSGRFFRETSRR